MNNRKKDVRRMTGLAILTAIVVVLQILASFVRFGPVSITLALAPIIIGAALYGVGAGAYLGLVFSLVVLLSGLLGWDGGFIMSLMAISPLGLLLTVFLKGGIAGGGSGLVYRLLARKNERTAVLTAGIVCPLLNTGIFVVLMLIFFLDTMNEMAAGQNMLVYIVTVLAGINFAVELLVNLALSSGITHIIKSQKNWRKHT